MKLFERLLQGILYVTALPSMILVFVGALIYLALLKGHSAAKEVIKAIFYNRGMFK